MHTICVPVAHDRCPTPPYIAQAMGAFSTLTTHRMHLLLTAEQNDWLESQATGLRNKSAVVRDLIDTARQGLTGGSNVGAYSVGAGDQSVRVQAVPAVQAVPEPPTASETAVQAVEVLNSFSPSGPFLGESVGSRESERRTPRKPLSFSRDIPDALDPFAALIEEFWRVKKGSKSSNAWSLLITELEKINASFGKERTEEQLTLAINGLWKGVTMRNMQRFETPKGNTPAQADHKHPAYRDASEVIAESERLAQQNIEHLRRKAEERNTSGGVLEGLF